MLLLLWLRSGPQQGAHALGCEQKKGGVPKMHLKYPGRRRNLSWASNWKRICYCSSLPLCWVPNWSFPGKGSAVPAAEVVSGTAPPHWALGKGAAVSPLLENAVVCVCPICQAVLIPEICPKIAQTLLLAILLPSRKPDNFFSQP